MRFQSGEVYVVERKNRGEKEKLKKKAKIVFLKQIKNLFFFKHEAGYMECFSQSEIDSGSVAIRRSNYCR